MQSAVSKILRRSRQLDLASLFPGAGRAGAERWPHRAALAAGAVAGIATASGLGFWLLPPSSRPFTGSAPEESAATQAGNPPPAEKKQRFLLPDSYRRRVFFNYERRLRLRSPPEKIFEYFASIQSPDGEIFMSPADLMRAVVPVFPPSESGIVREGYLRGEPHYGHLHCDPSEFFMLFDTNKDGRISFPEYIFFVTLLSIPESNFEVAFKMFDLDNNGEIEIEEFKKVMRLMRSYNRQGSYYKEGLRTGLKSRGSVDNHGLLQYFFGEDGKGRLPHSKFVHFLRELHNEIVRLEFAHYDFKSRGAISARDFALSMVSSADVDHVNKLLKRVDMLNSNPNLADIRISFEEFKLFAELRRRLQPLSLALFSYGEINGLLTKQDFRRAALQVCGVSVTENMIDIIFHIFDTNNDGHLSSDEFLRALQRRENDIRQPPSTGIFGPLSRWFCKKNNYLVT